MWLKLRQGLKRQKFWQWQGILMTAGCVAAFVIVARAAGFFQLVEWAALDQFFRLRPQEPIDSRIVIVTIDESDLNYVGRWPIPDAVLAQLIENLKQEQPCSIGLDIYRDLPVEPGYQELVKVMESTPNLIGVEKVVEPVIPPPRALRDLKQVAFADLVLDADGKVRRGLLSVKLKDGKIRLSLGVRLALMYLENEGITYKMIDASKKQLGQAVLVPLSGNEGGYILGDNAAGYQILLNFRGTLENFQTISMRDVLEKRIPRNWVRDRIVLIGSSAESLKDFFFTPYSSSQINSVQQTPGIVIHANLISQILSAALDGRPMIQVWVKSLESLWILVCSLLGAWGSWMFLESNLFRKNIYPGWTVLGICILLVGGTIMTGSYLAFLKGWWIPMVPAIVAFMGSVMAIAGYHHQKLNRLVSIDSLTQVANRRMFDEYLQQEWWRMVRTKSPLSLILCDVDCFKTYNDTYGHQAGDHCLQEVAKAISQAIRCTDVVARYGGEEFAVVLPNTHAEIAVSIAQKIRIQVRALRMTHTHSHASQYVTVSCGVASIVFTGESSPTELSPTELIAAADLALYDAKTQGRNRVILR